MMPQPISSRLAEAIADHEAKHSAWVGTAEDGCLPEDTPEEKAALEAELRLVTLPCHSWGEVQAKVRYLYDAASEAARGARDNAQIDAFREFLGSLIGISEDGE